MGHVQVKSLTDGGVMSIKRRIAMHPNRGEKETLDKRGFTLLEVLIAIFILALGLLAVATMQISAVRGNRLGNEVIRATYLAQDKLEEVKNSTDIASEPDGSDQQGIFNRAWLITANTAYSRIVTVTVDWTVGGASHELVLTTITRGGGY
ncbi:MAG: prepilin-type N-terminal cleavage/methylation domain-containing protein [Deltaproteobacteria bacterium]|nr:MAG: prepilin-type N-terminal cleavage/methylation domain-containing protein [Deltaproteobacteria bacterium]